MEENVARRRGRHGMHKRRHGRAVAIAVFMIVVPDRARRRAVRTPIGERVVDRPSPGCDAGGRSDT
jgi:hypothetical protein